MWCLRAALKGGDETDDEEERRATVGGLLLLEGIYGIKAILKGLGGGG